MLLINCFNKHIVRHHCCFQVIDQWGALGPKPQVKRKVTIRLFSQCDSSLKLPKICSCCSFLSSPLDFRLSDLPSAVPRPATNKITVLRIVFVRRPINMNEHWPFESVSHLPYTVWLSLNCQEQTRNHPTASISAGN